MSDNYPLGAANNPRAAYNDKRISSMCVHCNYDELKEIAKDNAKYEAYKWNKCKSIDENSVTYEQFYDECLQEVMDEASECKQCYFENYDDWKEDIE